jgi:hypothetical protein
MWYTSFYFNEETQELNACYNGVGRGASHSKQNLTNIKVIQRILALLEREHNLTVGFSILGYDINFKVTDELVAEATVEHDSFGKIPIKYLFNRNKDIPLVSLKHKRDFLVEKLRSAYNQKLKSLGINTTCQLKAKEFYYPTYATVVYLKLDRRRKYAENEKAVKALGLTKHTDKEVQALANRLIPQTGSHYKYYRDTLTRYITTHLSGESYIALAEVKVQKALIDEILALGIYDSKEIQSIRDRIDG